MAEQKKSQRKFFVVAETDKVWNRIEVFVKGQSPKKALDDFVIINKIQERLKINIRKDKKDFNQPARSLINQEKENPPKKAQSSFQASSMSGNDIELFTEDPKSSED